MPFGLLTALAVALVVATPASAQDDLADACTAAAAPAECRLVASAVRLTHARIGVLLWGGNPVPGTASTVGQRVPGAARFSFSTRLLVAPITLPPLIDRTEQSGRTGIGAGAGVQGVMGLSQGFSPLPTVGGVLSLDAIVRASAALAPGGLDFDPVVAGGVVGLRVGLLRESFTLPGVSATAMAGRSTTVTLGDPDGIATDGAVQGPITVLSAAGTASKRIFGFRLTAGATLDRYLGTARIRYSPGGAGSSTGLESAARTDRWSAFGSLTWTRLVYHAVIEAGWQESPSPTGLPPGVEVSPVGWWVSLGGRVTP